MFKTEGENFITKFYVKHSWKISTDFFGGYDTSKHVDKSCEGKVNDGKEGEKWKEWKEKEIRTKEL